MRCEHCSEVLEIVGLRHHLISIIIVRVNVSRIGTKKFDFTEDCDFKDKYMICNMCLEVIENEFLEQHVLEPTCKSQYNIKIHLRVYISLFYFKFKLRCRLIIV